MAEPNLIDSHVSILSVMAVFPESPRAQMKLFYARNAVRSMLEMT